MDTDFPDRWVTAKILFQCNRHFTVLNFLCRRIHTRQRNKAHFFSNSARSASQAWHRITSQWHTQRGVLPPSFPYQAEKNNLFTATAIAHNPTLIRGTVGCIFRFFLLVIAYKHNIVIRQALKDKVIRDTVIDDFKIYSSPEKILCNHSVGSTFFQGEEAVYFPLLAVAFHRPEPESPCVR